MTAAEVPITATATKPTSTWPRRRRQRRRQVHLSLSTKVLLAILGLMVLISVFGTTIAPYSTTATDPAENSRISRQTMAGRCSPREGRLRKYARDWWQLSRTTSKLPDTATMNSSHVRCA